MHVHKFIVTHLMLIYYMEFFRNISIEYTISLSGIVKKIYKKLNMMQNLIN